MEHIPTDFKKLIENKLSVEFYLKNISTDNFIKDLKSALLKNEISQKIPKKTIEQRKEDFKNELVKYLPIYGRDMLNEFFKYWTEPNRSNTKLKLEYERTWDIKLRLARWDSNNIGKYKKPIEEPKTIIKLK